MHLPSPLATIRGNLGVRPLIMGILNVTPDSFYDGGKAAKEDLALGAASRMVAEGCDIIDIGGESTRPGAEAVSASQETKRILPVVARVSQQFTVPISIDTYKAEVAEEAIRCGAGIVNDIWGLQGDPRMAQVVAQNGCMIVAMHNRQEVAPDIDIIDDIRQFFERSVRIGTQAGIAREDIILDPGIGFGKTFEQNIDVLKNLGKLNNLGFPLLLGLSRKSFIGRVLGNEAKDRLIGTVVSHLVGLQRGAAILRVHDVKEHVETIKMMSALGVCS